MKIKEIIKKIPFKRVISFFGNLITKADPFKEYRTKIVHVINGIKMIVESPITEDIVKLTPWDQDDKILAFIRGITAGVLKDMGLATSSVPLTAVEEAANFLRDIPKRQRSGYYTDMGGKLYEASSGLPPEVATQEIQREYKKTEDEPKKDK